MSVFNLITKGSLMLHLKIKGTCSVWCNYERRSCEEKTAHNCETSGYSTNIALGGGDHTHKHKNTHTLSLSLFIIQLNMYFSSAHGTHCGPGISVVIVTDYQVDSPGSNRSRDKIFHLSIPALGPTQSPVKWVRDLSQG